MTGCCDKIKLSSLADARALVKAYTESLVRIFQYVRIGIKYPASQTITTHSTLKDNKIN